MTESEVIELIKKNLSIDFSAKYGCLTVMILWKNEVISETGISHYHDKNDVQD